jgi:hypothetical protein
MNKNTSFIIYIFSIYLVCNFIVQPKIYSQGKSVLTELAIGKSFSPNNKHEYYSGIKGYDSSFYYGIFADFNYSYEKQRHGFDNIYIQVRENSRYGIYKVDSNLNFICEKYFVLHKKLRSRKFEDMIVFFDTIYALYSEKKINETQLYVQKINKITLEKFGEERLLFTKKDLKGNYARFKFISSPKRNKLLIVSKTHVLISKSIGIDFRVYGKGLLQEWQREEFISYNHQSPKEINYIVDNLGNVHSIMSIFEEKVLSSLFSSQILKNEY